MATLVVYASTDDGQAETAYTTTDWATALAQGAAGVATTSGFLTIHGPSIDGSSRFRLSQAGVTFDTSALTASAVIESAIFEMFRITGEVGSITEVVARDYGGTIGTGDYMTQAEVAALTPLVSYTTADPDEEYKSFGDIKSVVSKTGTTSLWMFPQSFRTGVYPGGQSTAIFMSANTAGTTNDPRLTITYTVPPVAAFSADVTSGEAPLTVTFTDESTNTPTSWAWVFGDEGTSDQQNPEHEYTAAGTYTVSLVAANLGGSDDEVKVDYIEVTEPPAGGSTSPRSLRVGSGGIGVHRAGSRGPIVL